MINRLKQNLPILMGTISILLLLIQFFYNRSLWIDEAKLALNLLDRGYLELMQPLESTIVAPILFLWVEKFMISIFGHEEYVLRLFPLIAAIAVISFSYKLFLKLLQDRKMAIIAYSFLIFNYSFLYYGNEAKQYSSDLAIAILILWFYIKEYRDIRYQRMALLLLGIVAIFISNVSVIVLTVVGVSWLMKRYKELKRVPVKEVIVTGLWFVAFLLYYLWFINDHPMRQEESKMMAFWQYAFPPEHLFSSDFLHWISHRFDMVFNRLLFFPSKFSAYKFFGVAYLLSILVMIIKKRFKLLFVLCGPIVLHFVLAYLKLYPFELRVMVYQIPLYLLTMAFGFVSLLNVVAKKSKSKSLKWIGLALLLFPSIQMFRQVMQVFPFEKEAFKKSWEFVVSDLRNTDTIYVYNATTDPFKYYQRIGYIDVPNPIMFGDFHRDDFGKHETLSRNLNGRVWVIISHYYLPINRTDGEQVSEGDFIIKLLNTRGTEIKRAVFERSKAVLIEIP